MDEPQFRMACEATAELLLRANPNAVALRQPERENGPHHLLWMLGCAKGFYFEAKAEKANRWLGFVQGVMSAVGFATVEELKKANMPPGDVFDGDRV